jgi:hypothetical protein
MTFKVLTAAENGGDSESMTAVQDHGAWAAGSKDEFRFTIDLKRNVTILVIRDGREYRKIQWANLDLKGMISFLQDMQTFISEEEMIAKLKTPVATRR